MDKRLGWDEYFLEISKVVAIRADCTRSKVGSVLVDPNHRIIGTGYNGAPSGVPGCLSGACPRGKLSYEELPPESDYSNCISNHAEFNAVVYALPEERRGSTLYVTRRPCVLCKELLLAEGIVRVVWLSSNNELCSEPLFEQREDHAGIYSLACDKSILVNLPCRSVRRHPGQYQVSSLGFLMPRAPSRCSPTCPNHIFKYGKCKTHQPEKVAWAGSKRQSDFFKSAEWQRQRRRIIFREKGKCQNCKAPDSRQVDHIMPVWYTGREQVTDEELQLLCDDCHNKKSSFEGVQAKKIRKEYGIIRK